MRVFRSARFRVGMCAWIGYVSAAEYVRAIEVAGGFIFIHRPMML